MRLAGTILRLFQNHGSDGDLLRQYVATRDEASFTELVRRLGPMVMGICRRVLSHHSDAEDAFQATFLILARKANTIQPPGRVAAWLHGVATLAARKACESRRRRNKHTLLGFVPEVAVMPVTPTRELAEVLDEELQALPEKYRLPVVLCHLRERTLAQAAEELEWPIGTVASRLSRGRQWLAKRLMKRGITSAAVGLAALPGAKAVVPFTLLRLTAKAAISSTESLSPVVQILTQEVLKAMMTNSLRLIVAGVVSTVGLALCGSGLLVAPSNAAQNPVTKPMVKAKPSLERLKLKNAICLLCLKEVQKELKLTDQQRSSIIKHTEKVVMDERAAMGIQEKPSDPPKDAKDAELYDYDLAKYINHCASISFGTAVKKSNEFIEKELAEQQLHRLKQIQLQSQSPRILLDRYFIREFQYSLQQEEALAELLEVQKPIQIYLMAELVDGTADDSSKAKEQLEQHWTKALEILNPQQREQWNHLLGHRIDEELQKWLCMLSAHIEFALYDPTSEVQSYMRKKMQDREPNK